MNDSVESGKVTFVIYQYAVSFLLFTMYGSSRIYEISEGASRVRPGWPYTILSLFLGWWGIPFGPLRTAQALIVNLGGGEDVTLEVNKALYGVEEPAQIWECPRCQGENPNTSYVCGHCGSSLI